MAGAGRARQAAMASLPRRHRTRRGVARRAGNGRTPARLGRHRRRVRPSAEHDMSDDADVVEVATLDRAVIGLVHDESPGWIDAVAGAWIKLGAREQAQRLHYHNTHHTTGATPRPRPQTCGYDPCANPT